MSGLTQVTFRFGAELEVRYLEQVPKRGDRVMRGGSRWIVTGVEVDRSGPVATSNHAREFVRAARVNARRMRETGLRQREKSASQLEAGAKTVEQAADLKKRMPDA